MTPSALVVAAAALAAASPVDDSIAFGAAGWLVAIPALALGVWQRRRLDDGARLISEAAHELRGPLCAARLAIAALESAVADAPVVNSRLGAVDLELQRAGLAVDDLCSAIDAGHAPAGRELLDVNELLAASEPVWRALAHAHGATLEVRPRAEPALVLANRLRLGQAIGNLVANACEHGGGMVGVGVRVVGARTRVEVSDQGHGLHAPVHELSRRSVRRRTLRRNSPSARGHGLAVAGRVADELGGRLAAAPARLGACLVLELPTASQRASRQRRSS